MFQIVHIISTFCYRSGPGSLTKLRGFYRTINKAIISHGLNNGSFHAGKLCYLLVCSVRSDIFQDDVSNSVLIR